MANITLKKIPDDLYQHLKQRATQNRRSLNSEIIACLQAAVGTKKVDPQSLLTRARALREGVSGYLTDEWLEQLKNQGRP